MSLKRPRQETESHTVNKYISSDFTVYKKVKQEGEESKKEEAIALFEAEVKRIFKPALRQ